MGKYTYKATDSKGKIVRGKIDATNETEVTTQLARLGYIPISIGFESDKQGPSLVSNLFKKGMKRASAKSVIVFTRQFATIIKAAVPLLEGLGVLAEQAEDENLRESIHAIVHDIEEGNKLSEALAKHSGVFSPLYVNTVVAGEAGGVLDKVLLRLALVMEEEEETRSSVSTALRYPIMVVVALFVAVIVLSLFVMPQFAKVYQGMKVALPLPTQVMIFISNSLRHYWFIAFPFVIAIPFSIKFLINTPQGRIYWDSFKFQAPVFGKIYNKIVMLRFATMLNVLYQSGLPILRILDIVKLTIGNVVLAGEMDKVKKDVADGKGVSGGILNSKLFPRLVGYMISIGEKAGALTSMLDSLCEYYTLEVRTALKNLTTLIEPLMTGVLGFVIAGMALAIFMPMWNLISAVKQSM